MVYKNKFHGRNIYLSMSQCHMHEKLQEQELSQGHNKEKNHKKCKPKSNPRL
jgi:hypothetical protein